MKIEFVKFLLKCSILSKLPKTFAQNHINGPEPLVKITETHLRPDYMIDDEGHLPSLVQNQNNNIQIHNLDNEWLAFKNHPEDLEISDKEMLENYKLADLVEDSEFGGRPEEADLKIRKSENDSKYYQILNSEGKILICHNPNRQPKFVTEKYLKSIIEKEQGDSDSDNDAHFGDWIIKKGKNEDDTFILIHIATNGYLTYLGSTDNYLNNLKSRIRITCDMSCDFGLCEKNLALEDEVTLDDNHYFRIEEI